MEAVVAEDTAEKPRMNAGGINAVKEALEEQRADSSRRRSQTGNESAIVREIRDDS